MRDLLEQLVRAIVLNDDAVQVVEQPGSFQTTYTVRASGKDVGRLVGKKGNTIDAIRKVADLIAERDGLHYTIWVEELEAALAAA